MAQYLLVLLFAQLSFANIPKTTLVNEALVFSDDIEFENMNLAIERQLKSFESLNLKLEMKFGETTYKRSDLKESLLTFKKLIGEYKDCQTLQKKACMDDFSKKVNSLYNVYRPVPLSWERGFKEGKTFFTTYYSPDFEGSFVKTERFKYPIYKKPKDAALAAMTRTQIDFESKFAGKGLEIAYVDSSYYDLWLFHVEGGGRLKVKGADGAYSYYHLSYAGSNNKSFSMLSSYMLAQKMITPENKSVLAQRAYLERHPEDVQKVMASCPSYIYFKITHDEPLGVRNIPLTEKRSLATDRNRYKVYGILNFIEAKKAKKIDSEHFKLVDYSRFYISQDTGGAIKGNARSDLYFGYGEEAALNANSVSTLGNQYFLLLKKAN